MGPVPNSDDYLLPDKLASQIIYLNRHPETDVQYGLVTKLASTDKGWTHDVQVIPEPHDP